MRPGDRTDHKGAQLVNEPGTWNFSDLNTREHVGEGDFTMWRVPGYGDFLELNDPDLRSRQGEFGAPEGFEDAIAWLAPITSDQFPGEVPPHWSVSFTVDDADAMAARAAELGGTVTVPPFDAGPTRVAVLADPQGAVFSVSKFDPDA